MEPFHYQDNDLYVEEVSLSKVAQEFGTPCYVYSRAALEHNWQAFDKAFTIPHRMCYAVKANSNLAILNLFARHQSGFDIVSIGELERVLAAGGNPKNIVFSGVGKKPAEINRALEVDIHCFNVESEVELERINTLAKHAGKIASVALRINPNIDARTHPYIATGLKENKFGIEIEKSLPICRAIKKLSHIKLIGIACHIGSQLVEISPFLEALDRVKELAASLAAEDIVLEHLNIGGGLGICYNAETPPSITEYVKTICEHMQGLPYEIILEPGRAITANAGVLLTEVEYIKRTPYKNFAIVDAAMNDLMRPALYEAWQKIVAVNLNTSMIADDYDIVGPVCETADFLGKNRNLAIDTGSLLAICSAGAYGFSMSSNYNSRPRAAEVMVDLKNVYLIRRRETINELYSGETILD